MEKWYSPTGYLRLLQRYFVESPKVRLYGMKISAIIQKSRPTILQKPIVVRLYQEFLDGKTTDYIKRIFEKEGVRNWDGGTKWQATTLMSMLENEKYKGDTLLQKSYTVDFLTKKRTQNKGEIQMFYVEDDHDAIISKRIWECVQLEIKRRKKYLEEHGTNSYFHRPESNPFASKIICGDCNKVFARKGWRSSTGVDRKVWQCSERYKVKGVMGCANRHVEEETLIKAYLMAWNALVENREDFMEQWTEQLQSENLLESYRAEKFIEYTDGAKPLTEMDTDFMLKTLDHIKVLKMEHCWWSSWTERRLNVKMKRSKKRCRLGVAIPGRPFFLLFCGW